ncbi:unnamed protein product [Trifolium pratense]|uniref:Uncharacterized protein n=1 Tax=Trifolium pratense TaxID=57577 RepID=A0ACB0LL13_TRIPR|nr:unnamed protein product [Trifolium pratense]
MGKKEGNRRWMGRVSVKLASILVLYSCVWLGWVGLGWVKGCPYLNTTQLVLGSKLQMKELPLLRGLCVALRCVALRCVALQYKPLFPFPSYMHECETVSAVPYQPN